MSKVNLDALIPREDFEVTGTTNSGNLKYQISVSDLTSGFFYPFLRKPDFQRETNEWDSKKVCDFIESFINGDLIPSIILWRSGSGLFFVIDGAHRLSALSSWINDDFGDGKITSQFYDNNVSEDHKKIAEETRKLVNKRIGSYKSIIESSSLSNPIPEYIQRAKNLGAYSIQVQWVDGDASKAESSFFKINQQGEPLNNTEIKLLQARHKPNCIAARAIINAGKGHKYWANFTAENQSRIQELSKEINTILFTPSLQTPVKTLDIPIAGKLTSAQSLPLILDFINIVNSVSTEFKTKLQDDLSGDETIKYLLKVRKVAWRINSIHPSSLGLHPIAYFYSIDGRHKTASFYAITAMILEFENKGTFNQFVNVRSKFEELLLKYDYMVQDINRKYRQAINSYIPIRDFFLECIKRLFTMSVDDTILDILKLPNFSYLKIENQLIEVSSSEFSTERKSAIFLKEAIQGAPRCKICNGFIHRNSVSIDHIDRKEDGGTGSVDNGQITHPYCNTTYKN